MIAVVISRAAAHDLDATHSWYETQRSGLGDEFLSEVRATAARIAAHLDAYRIVRGSVRRALVRRYPYVIYFRVVGPRARVIAILHQRRDPRAWRRRT